MKVSVYRDLEGGLSVLVEATPGKGRAPVLLRPVALENIAEQVAPVIVAMRRPKGAEFDPPRL